MNIPVYTTRGRLHDWATVDDVDAELLGWLWKVNPEGYAVRYTKHEGTVRMHRQIMGLALGDPREVDHINHDPLDNRRHNLRIVERQQNQQNRRGGNRGSTSQYRGVTYDKRTGRWMATCTVNGHSHWLGRHGTEEQAAEVAAEFRRQHMPYSKEAATA